MDLKKKLLCALPNLFDNSLTDFRTSHARFCVAVVHCSPGAHQKLLNVSNLGICHVRHRREC